MRRALALQALITMAWLTLSPIASAAPTATLKLTALPIPGFPGTGNILGAGAEVEVQVTISGSEYGGFPSPLTEATFYSPVGVQVSPTGFTDCAESVLEAQGASGCPRDSMAGPKGQGLGVVSFGTERVPETVSIQGFFAPTGLTFYVEGDTPASFQIVEKARWMPAITPFGQKLVVDVPLVETVPGADAASILSFKVKVGAAYRKAGKTISYFTLPRSCPRGGFPLKAELKFLSGETTTVAYQQPCPKASRGRAR